MSDVLELNETNVLQLLIDRIDTPIGEMILVADRDGNLHATDWTDHEPRMHNFLRRRYANGRDGNDGFKLTPTRNPGGLSRAISSYFAGDLTAIDNLPVKTNGTAFQCQVWQALREIPLGTTISYGELANRIGRPTAVRAVGLANGSNPVGVIVPCHRVIGSNGSLTGYGGGMERKRWLLEHERPGAHPSRSYSRYARTAFRTPLPGVPPPHCPAISPLFLRIYG